VLKDELAKAFVTTESFLWGEGQGFTLASGVVSPFYVDCRTLMAYPASRHLVTQLAFDVIKDLAFDCIGGLEIGSISIAAVLSDYAYRTAQKEWRTFIVRKQPKGHGTGRQIEGAPKPGDRALIVDDVLTSGASVMKAVQVARERGLQVSHALVIVDRQEQDGRTRVEQQAITLLSLLTIDALKAKHLELTRRPV